MSLCTLHPPSRRARRSIKPPESTPPTPIPMPNLSGNETRTLPIPPILCPRCPCCCLCDSSFLFHTFISELNVVKPAAQSGFLPVITGHPWCSGVSLSTHFRCRWRPSLLLAIEWRLSTQPFTTNYSPHHTSSSPLKMIPPPGNNWSPSELRIFPHFRVKTAQRMFPEASSIVKICAEPTHNLSQQLNLHKSWWWISSLHWISSLDVIPSHHILLLHLRFSTKNSLTIFSTHHQTVNPHLDTWNIVTKQQPMQSPEAQKLRNSTNNAAHNTPANWNYVG